MLHPPGLRLAARHALALTRPKAPSTILSTSTRQAPTTTPFPPAATALILPHRRLPTNPAPKAPLTILEQQRLHRPVSPHATIYRPQITWLGSITGRVAGSLVAGALDLFFAGYAVAPVFGWDLGSEAAVAFAAGLPGAVKVGARALAGWAVSYHCLNGVRHLVWDFAVGVNNRAVMRSGWVVVGLSVCGAVGSALY